MKKEGYYSTGEFMKQANITKKTIRYYDEKDILKPSFVSDSGARYYTEKDLAKLQQILLLKYLGFSLSDIREMQVDDADKHFIVNSLNIQQKLVEDRIEQLQLVSNTICEATEDLQADREVDWTKLFELIQVTDLEGILKKQYKDASNIMARINLHKQYSVNPQGWFPWIYEQMEVKAGQKILELGCGAGDIWVENTDRLPPDVTITVTDISEGMLRDARREIGREDAAFSYELCECEQIPFADDTFDLVIANHVLFYCEDIEKACREIRRVLKPGGMLVAGTYGSDHMKEISQLVLEFDTRIILAAENLYDRFGKENGVEMLDRVFKQVEWRQYEDAIEIDDAEPLISYVLSCHGNQNQYIAHKYKEFRAFMKKKTAGGFHITKDAGIFIAKK